MQKPTRLMVLLLVSLAAFAGCENKQNDDVPSAATSSSTNPSSLSSNAAPALGSSEKTAAPDPKSSASSEVVVEAPNDLVGTWEGSYEAKKGAVEMPAKVKDKVRTKDDGKTATGKGTITITVGKDGELKGKTEGALGTATLSGKAEGKNMSAQFFPDDALSKLAMFGIVQGTLENDHVACRIRVASGDAAIIREANIVLKKK